MGEKMHIWHKVSKLTEVTLDDDLLDRLDGISNSIYEGTKHIKPSKYESRVSIVGGICDALMKANICSICGNGATSLAKKLTILARKYQIFRKIAIVTVSPKPKLQDIQSDIMEQIQQVWIGNCLLILDGFWWELNDEDFKAIGIPSPSKSFGIVFTSRNAYMCSKIENNRIFHVNFLEDEEAWGLFMDKAGKSVEDLGLHEIARKIVDECDGFRIVVLTLASALKDKPENVWKDSLTKLQDPNGVYYIARKFISVISNKGKLFFSNHLSYNLLNDKESQLLFSLCCLFPKDFDIPVEDLVLFSKGLQLFQNVKSMCQLRDRVECIIRRLRNACFVLDGKEDGFVKVHSMCHDFGVVMLSELKHPYVVRCENHINGWPFEKMQYKNCRALSFTCKTVKQHPIDLKCANLHLLQFSCGSDSAQLPTGIFKGLKNLKVLSLSIPSLSQPLTVLKQLRTLCVTESISDSRYIKPRPRIGDLLGDQMKDLESFSFSTARPYDEFPREIGLLHNLRFLKFNRERLKYIPKGVLSKLTKLEELYLPLDFISWGCKEEGGERINASLSEIDSLQITALQIGIAKGSILTETLVEKLTRFHVFIGSHVSSDYEFGTIGNSKRLLEVFDIDADDFRVSWISDLVRKSESLRLKQVRNLKNIITWECQPTEKQNTEFPEWKKICVSDCQELEYLVAGRIPWTCFAQLNSLKLFGLCNLKEIWSGLYQSEIEGSCFGNLCEIQIMFCKKLKYVFSVSVATKLRQLQCLEICFCDEMETIFCREEKNNDRNQVATGKAELRDSTVEITSTLTPTVNIHHKSKIFSLTPISLTGCLFGREKQPKLVTSKNQVEENIEKEEEKDAAKDAIIFPQLKTMELAYMDKLRIFYDGNHSILLPSLQSLSIFRCNRLEAFSYGLYETPLLRQIQINENRYSVTEALKEELKGLKDQSS